MSERLCRCGCGRTCAEIVEYAEAEGITRSAAYKRLHPERVKEYARRDNARPERAAAKKAWADLNYRQPCPKCGGPMGVGSHRRNTGCQTCRLEEAESKRAQIHAGYLAGLTVREIAECTGIPVTTVTTEAYRMRERGIDVPKKRDGRPRRTVEATL